MVLRLFISSPIKGKFKWLEKQVYSNFKCPLYIRSKKMTWAEALEEKL